MTYPVFFRKKVLSYREKNNLTIKEVVVHFNIGSATVSHWVSKLEPETTRIKTDLKILDDVLRTDVEKYPDVLLCYLEHYLRKVGKSFL